MIGRMKASVMNDENIEADSIAIATAQLQGVRSNIRVSLIANTFIAASATLIMFQATGSRTIFGWLTCLVLLNLLRLFHASWLAKQTENTTDPRATLHVLTLLAFAGGLVWMPLPFFFAAAVETKAAAYVVFIMCGITTGAIIQSLAYWPISVAFAAPIMSGTVLSLFIEGQTTDYIVATNVALLMGMLFRIAVISESTFRANWAVARQATALAQSLQDANLEVQTANDTLRRLATTDPLTGLPNRSAFNEELAALARAHQPVALALIDIDNFKQVNDSHGHAAGDQILCSLGLSMLTHSMPGLSPIRLGGDEFAVIGSGHDFAARTRRYIEKVRKDMKSVAHLPGAPAVTLSTGICVDDEVALTAAELFGAADQALYAAKAAGRNCVREHPAFAETVAIPAQQAAAAGRY